MAAQRPRRSAKVFLVLFLQKKNGLNFLDLVIFSAPIDD
jgi:hypothetical protein